MSEWRPFEPSREAEERARKRRCLIELTRITEETGGYEDTPAPVTPGLYGSGLYEDGG